MLKNLPKPIIERFKEVAGKPKYSEEQLSALTPEERASYDKWVGRQGSKGGMITATVGKMFDKKIQERIKERDEERKKAEENLRRTLQSKIKQARRERRQRRKVSAKDDKRTRIIGTILAQAGDLNALGVKSLLNKTFKATPVKED